MVRVDFTATLEFLVLLFGDFDGPWLPPAHAVTNVEILYPAVQAIFEATRNARKPQFDCPSTRVQSGACRFPIASNPVNTPISVSEPTRA